MKEPKGEERLKFWRDRIRQFRKKDDPLRAALGTQGAADYLRWIVTCQRILNRWVQPGDKVLEVGCGCGDLSMLMPAGVRYHGVDLVPEFIEEAIKCWGPRFVVRDATDLGWLRMLTTNDWDVVLAVNTMGSAAVAPEHVAELVRAGNTLVAWSFHHTEPEVWKLVEGKVVKIREAT